MCTENREALSVSSGESRQIATIPSPPRKHASCASGMLESGLPRCSRQRPAAKSTHAISSSATTLILPTSALDDGRCLMAAQHAGGKREAHLQRFDVAIVQIGERTEPGTAGIARRHLPVTGLPSGSGRLPAIKAVAHEATRRIAAQIRGGDMRCILEAHRTRIVHCGTESAVVNRPAVL